VFSITVSGVGTAEEQHVGARGTGEPQVRASEGVGVGEPFLLLIDENPDDVYLMLRELRRLEPHLRVNVITDSAEALAYLRETKELPAAVLLGLKFIRLSGLELLAELRSLEKTRKLPVVMLTAGREERERVCREVVESEPVTCVSKPVDRGMITTTLGELGIRLAPALAG
jgi:two-component system response regulator